MHYKLDSVLVLLWPWLCNVDQSLEQHHAVSYHVKIEFPPKENIDKLPRLTVRPTAPTWWRSLQTSASPLLVWTACWGHWPREIPVSLCLHTGSEWILYLSGVSDHTIYLLLQILSALGDIKYFEPLILPMNCYLVPAGSRTFCMKTWGCDGQVS